MEVPSTITSPGFFGLVVVLWDAQIAHFPSGVELFETLHMMYEARSFNLVFLIKGGYSISLVRQRMPGRVVELVVMENLSSLDPLPTIPSQEKYMCAFTIFSLHIAQAITQKCAFG